MSAGERLAAVVILYYPPDNVLDNIKSYYDYVDAIYVYDNTDTKTSINDKFLQLPKVQYYHDLKNEGISKRLNSAAQLAILQSFDWLLTMDQDTSFDREAIETYLSCFKNFKNKEQVGMFGTEYKNTKTESSNKCIPEEADNLITSGMLLNLHLYKKIGPFDENLFIDSVDHDYCIRAKAANYPIIKFRNVYIHHHLGEEVWRSSIKTLYLIKKKKIIHSPQRCYYMFRNMLYLQKKYEGTEVSLAYNLSKIVTGNLKTSFFYGRNAVRVIRYLLLGYQHFKKGLLGKLERKS